MLQIASLDRHAEAGQPAADTKLPANNPQADASDKNPSILRNAIDSVVESVWRGKPSSARNVVEEGLTQFATAVPLFMGGTRGYALSATLYALNQAKCGDSASHQFEDMSLGAFKGVASKATFDYIGAKRNWNFAAKGVAMGASSRAWDLGLTRQTYVAADGTTDVVGGIERVAAASLNPAALATDVATFGVAHLAGGALGTKLSKSPLLSTVFTGSTFGFTSGALSEIQKERQTNEGFNLSKILASAGEQSLIMGAASAAGFKLTDAAHLPQVVRASNPQAASEIRAQNTSLTERPGTDQATSPLSALGQKFANARDLLAGRSLGLVFGSGDVQSPGGELTREIAQHATASDATATPEPSAASNTANEAIADTSLAKRLRSLLVPPHDFLIAADKPENVAANSAHSTPEQKMMGLFEDIIKPQGSHDLQMAHKYALQLFAQHPELQPVARDAVERLKADNAENVDIAERLVRVGFKPEKMDVGVKTQEQQDRLDDFLRLGRKLHYTNDHLETREKLYDMMRSNALPDHIAKQVHEQSRDPVLVSALDHYFGTDYVNSLPVTDRQINRLKEFQALQEDAWRQERENGPSPEVLRGRRIHEQRENMISMLKETNFAQNGGDWPSFMLDMFSLDKNTRWPQLDSAAVEATLTNVNTVLAKSRVEPDAARAQILESTALQMMRQAAEPRLTNQSQYPTCTMGSLEYYFWKMFPDEASRLVSTTVLNNGEFPTADGSVIHLCARDMQPEPDSLRIQSPYEFNQNPPRSYASQLFQMMTANIFWQRQSVAPDGTKVPVGSIEYKMTSTGDQLVFQYGPQRVVLGDTPRIRTAYILQDIGEQIGGARTVPNVIEWGTRFRTQDSFARKISSFDGEPVIVSIDHKNWLDGSVPAQNNSHAITIDGVARQLGAALYHNTWGEYYDHPVSVARLYNSLPR